MSTRLTITVLCSDQAAAVDLEQKIRGLDWRVSEAISSVEISSVKNSPTAGYSLPRELTPAQQDMRAASEARRAARAAEPDPERPDAV